MDWTTVGHELRQSAKDAHDGELPSLDIAYAFLLDNPECFSYFEVWPEPMPIDPPIELAVAYYRAYDATCDEPEYEDGAIEMEERFGL